VATTKDEHLGKVQENIGFLASLNDKVNGTLAWSITVLFYSALHYIEAYFVTQGKGFNHHFSRGNAIQQDQRIKSLYKNYRHLEDLSREARYDVTPFNSGDVRFAKRQFEAVERAIKAII
jgi:hypothetical protein